MPREVARHTLFLLMLLLLAGPASGQESRALAGRILDSAGEPIADAFVSVEGSSWRTITGRSGRFRVPAPAGEFRLRVSRAGYRPQVLTFTAAPIAPDSVIVRLEATPVALQGLTVEAPAAPAFAQTVTAATVRQVPPLGEPDVFRAVVLLPGVSQPNDLKGRIHLAGGSSDETGVRLDGHPLQDPFHVLGLLGAFNVAALERADVLIHHLPPRLGGRLSGVIDLESRRMGADAEYEAGLSLLSAGFTTAQPNLPGDFGLLASGRITYLDEVIGQVYENTPQLGFREGVVRLDRELGSSWRASALGFTTRDHFREPELAELAGYRPLTWGESLVGFNLDREGGRWDVSLRGSFDRAAVDLDERNVGQQDSVGFSRNNFIETERDWWSAAAETSFAAASWRATAGIGLDRRTNHQSWIARGLIDEIFSPNTPGVFTGEQAQTVAALFGAAGTTFGRWSGGVGARLESAGDGAYIAPRIHLGVRVSDALRLEAAADRRHQWDTQLEEPIEGSIAPSLFLLDEPRTADVAAMSARYTPERLPLATTGRFEVQAFRKLYRDRPLLAEIDPGVSLKIAPVDFPFFDRIAGTSTGATASGTFTFGEAGLLQGNYTYQRVQETIGGETSFTSWDVPHQLSVFGSLPALSGWTLNGVLQAHSGRATTPVIARIFEPGFDSLNELFARYVRGARNSIRVPGYRRLDLGARRNWQMGGADVTLSLQVLNVLASENPIDYDYQQYFGSLAGGSGSQAGRPGLPIIPSIGIEVRW